MRWTEEHKRYLREYYPFVGCKHFIEMFEKNFGIKVTPSAVKQVALVEGVTRYAPPGWYTVREVAYIFNITPENIQLRIKCKTIKANKFGGNRYLISEEEMEKLEKYYENKKIPWPAYTVKEAADRLGFGSHAAINQPAKRGYIDYIMIRNKRYVRKSDIEWGLKQMKDKGFTKIPWYILKKEKEKDVT